MLYLDPITHSDILNNVITNLVGYPFSVNVVFVEKKLNYVRCTQAQLHLTSLLNNEHKDFLELQITGAFGVLHNMYTDTERATKIATVCLSYNNANYVEYVPT